MSQFHHFPVPFWLVVLAIAFFAIRSWQQAESSLRLPMLMGLFTTTFWYIGDVLYNDYDAYLMNIEETYLQNAWWEVLWFVCAFGILVPLAHRLINRDYLGKPSNLLSLMYYGGLKAEKFQSQLAVICRFLLMSWVVMTIIALIRTDFDFKGLFMPYLGDKADPWGCTRLGSGYDSLLSAAGYFQIFLVATFGVIAALAYRPITFSTALIVWCLTLPAYIFDRTRSTILATILPGFLVWVFLRMRTGLLIKTTILIVGFLALESWLKFVIETRSDVSIATAFYNGITLHGDDNDNGKHLGLNMFEELGYINLYLGNGTYHPNWGERYFAELVNPIPRTLWPGKPLIGIDYAIARGQMILNPADDVTGIGVGATVSTGMIGQGVVNFGPFFGPLAAAMLMALWVSILARQDLLAAEPGRLFLYALGLILTFNMGRDITLLVIYPFCFGYLLLLLSKNWQLFYSAGVALMSKESPGTSIFPNGKIKRVSRR